MFFTEEIYYNDFISKGQLLDISDMVREPLSEITEGKETESIEDKLDDSQKAAFTALDGKYYFLPPTYISEYRSCSPIPISSAAPKASMS